MDDVDERSETRWLPLPSEEDVWSVLGCRRDVTSSSSNPVSQLFG